MSTSEVNLNLELDSDFSSPSTSITNLYRICLCSYISVGILVNNLLRYKVMITSTKRKQREELEDEDENPLVIKRRRWINNTVPDDQELISSLQDPNENLKMVCGSIYVPKSNPEKPLGEDAHFVSPEAQTIGVADGVGGWAKHGIDSGEYARELMSNASLATLLASSDETVDPKEVLRLAYHKTLESELPGSSTACIVSHSKGILRSANVGDSGFMIFRRNRLVYKSETQQRRFNQPYQLSNSEDSDRPESAQETEVEVMNGDVVVVGTDGLLDNVFPKEVESILMGESEENEGMVDVTAVASVIAEIALWNSFNRFIDTPFSLAATTAGKSRRGGKVDDITVVVGLIVDSTTSPLVDDNGDDDDDDHITIYN